MSPECGETASSICLGTDFCDGHKDDVLYHLFVVEGVWVSSFLLVRRKKIAFFIIFLVVEIVLSPECVETASSICLGTYFCDGHKDDVWIISLL